MTVETHRSRDRGSREIAVPHRRVGLAALVYDGIFTDSTVLDTPIHRHRRIALPSPHDRRERVHIVPIAIRAMGRPSAVHDGPVRERGMDSSPDHILPTTQPMRQSLARMALTTTVRAPLLPAPGHLQPPRQSPPSRRRQHHLSCFSIAPRAALPNVVSGL